MRINLKEYTVPGIMDAMEKALEDSRQTLLRAQAEVSALESVLREVNEHCGIDGCVGRFWDQDKKAAHQEQEHPQPITVPLGV